MRLTIVRLVLCAVLLVILVGGVFALEWLRCLFVPCHDIISIRGPGEHGEILPGMQSNILTH